MVKSIKYIKSVYKMEDLPTENRPIVFLMGRSNVGKSSFINYIANKKDLAKISSVPGKTMSLNYYLVDNKFYIVDSPGYGYAKLPKSFSLKWDEFLSKYFKNVYINLVLHLIDSKVGPTDKDIHAYEFTRNYIRNIVVLLTKVDRLNQSELSKSIKVATSTLNNLELNKNLYLVSVKIGRYKDNIEKLIYNNINAN